MSLFYFIWILQIPITILLNLFAFIFCCNFCKCKCCRGALFIADDESIPDAMNDGVMLHTAESIKNLHLDIVENQSNGYSIQAPPESPRSPEIASDHHNMNNSSNVNAHIVAVSDSGYNPSVNNRASMSSNKSFNYHQNHRDRNDDEATTTISILHWNIFGQLGRYWKRYPLLATQINDLSPDIISINEAVTVKWSVL